MRNVRTTLLLAIGLVAGMVLSGCSYQGAIRNDFHRSSVVNSAAKIPLRVGIVQSSEFKEKAFIQKAIDKNITINVQPYLANAIQTEMNTIFERAVLLKINDISDQKLDLLLVPKYEYSSIDTNRFFKTFTMKQEIGYTFTDYKTGKEIIIVNSHDTIDYSPPAGAKIAGFITGFTAFALSPITIPIETQSIGSHAVDELEMSLSKMIINQTEQIYINRKAFNIN